MERADGIGLDPKGNLKKKQVRAMTEQMERLRRQRDIIARRQAFYAENYEKVQAGAPNARSEILRRVMDDIPELRLSPIVEEGPARAGRKNEGMQGQ